MFEDLKQFRKVVVSGPHRAGTTICTRMIAHDTGHLFVPEEFYWRVHERVPAHMGFHSWVSDPFIRAAIQAPLYARELDSLPPEVCVVMVRRPVSDIVDSMRRMKRRDGRPLGPAIFRWYADVYGAATPEDGPAAVYRCWEDLRQRIRHWREVDYESLRAHPLWRDDREHFHFREAAGLST